jgi:hypothetical protein
VNKLQSATDIRDRDLARGSELSVRAHHLPNVILDFEASMHHATIMSGSDKREKREQIFETFAAQCLPQSDSVGRLWLRRPITAANDRHGSASPPGDNAGARGLAKT